MVNNSSYKPPDTLMTRVDWFSLAEELSADESEWNLTNWYVAFNFSAFGPKNETTLRYIVRHFTHIVMADRLALTIAYIIVCTPLLILQLTSLPIFVIHKNYWRNVCFRILFTNGCIDSIQLAAVLTYAVRNLWPSKFSPAFCRVGGAIVIPAYSLTVLQHFLLALNRFLVIMRARHMGSKWSRWIPDEEKEARIFNIAHVLCWQLYFAVVGLYLTPFVGANFNRNYLIFIFDITFPYTETLHALTTAVTLPLCVASFCIYCLIVCTTICSRLKIQKTDSAVTSSKAVGGRKTATFNVINDYEMRLLIQAIILYTSIAYLIIVWQFFDRCTSAALCEGRIFGKVLVDIPMRTHSMITGLPWMIFSGLSPILFLIMNKEFRSRYSRLYTRKSPDELSEIFSNSISTLVSCSSKTEREESDRQSMGGKKLVKGISHDAAQQMRKKNAIEEMNKRKITH